MNNINYDQIRGFFFESIIIYLLKKANLENVRPCVEKIDCGGKIQIDAYAKFKTIPLAYPIRFLIEAKAQKKKVGYKEIRDLKSDIDDLNLKFKNHVSLVTNSSKIPEDKMKKRHTLQGSFISTSGFDNNAKSRGYQENITLWDFSKNLDFLNDIRSLIETKSVLKDAKNKKQNKKYVDYFNKKIREDDDFIKLLNKHHFYMGTLNGDIPIMLFTKCPITIYENNQITFADSVFDSLSMDDHVLKIRDFVSFDVLISASEMWRTQTSYPIEKIEIFIQKKNRTEIVTFLTNKKYYDELDKTTDSVFWKKADKNIKFILEKMEGTYLDRSWLKHVTDIEEFNLDEHNDLNFICVGLRFKIKKSWFLADNFYLRLNGEGHSIADGEERYLIKTILDDTSIKKTKSENISLEELDKGIKLNPEVTDIIMPLKYYSHRMFLNPEKFRVESFQPFYFFESKKIRIHWATSKMDLNNNIIFLNNKAISVVKKNVSDISPIDSIPDYREFNLENRKISSLLRLEEIDVDITLRSCLSIKINYPSKVSILSVNNFE